MVGSKVRLVAVTLARMEEDVSELFSAPDGADGPAHCALSVEIARCNASTSLR